jgi:hypothetical protein
MANPKDGKVVTVEAKNKSDNNKPAAVIVNLVVVDGKLVADVSPGVRV